MELVLLILCGLIRRLWRHGPAPGVKDHQHVEQAGDDPEDTDTEADERSDSEREKKSTRERARRCSVDVVLIFVLAEHGALLPQRNLIRSGNMLCPPCPVKIELVSDGTSRIPTTNVPMTTSA